MAELFLLPMFGELDQFLICSETLQNMARIDVAISRDNSVQSIGHFLWLERDFGRRFHGQGWADFGRTLKGRL